MNDFNENEDNNLDAELTAMFERQSEHNRQTIDAGPIQREIAEKTRRGFAGWIFPTFLAAGAAAAVVVAVLLAGDNDNLTTVEVPPVDTLAPTEELAFLSLVGGYGDPDVAIAKLTEALGEPTSDSGWMRPIGLPEALGDLAVEAGSLRSSVCDGNRRQMLWGNLSVEFSDSELDSGLAGAIYDGPVEGLVLPIQVGASYEQVVEQYGSQVGPLEDLGETTIADAFASLTRPEQPWPLGVYFNDATSMQMAFVSSGEDCLGPDTPSEGSVLPTPTTQVVSETGPTTSDAAPPTSATPTTQAPTTTTSAPVTTTSTPIVSPPVPPPTEPLSFLTLGERDEDPETVIARVTSVLGAPTGDTGWRPAEICFGNNRWVNWGNLGLLFSDSDREFYRGFTAAGYSGSVPNLDLPVQVGETKAELAARYGDQLVDGNLDVEVFGPWDSLTFDGRTIIVYYDFENGDVVRRVGWGDDCGD